MPCQQSLIYIIIEAIDTIYCYSIIELSLCMTSRRSSGLLAHNSFAKKLPYLSCRAELTELARFFSAPSLPNNVSR